MHFQKKDTSTTGRLWHKVILSGVQLVWIQSFPSPRPVALAGQQNPACPTIYP